MSEFSLLRLNNVPLYVYTRLFAHPSMGGHLGCFYLSAVTNNAAVYMGVHPFPLFNWVVFNLKYIVVVGILLLL